MTATKTKNKLDTNWAIMDDGKVQVVDSKRIASLPCQGSYGAANTGLSPVSRSFQTNPFGQLSGIFRLISWLKVLESGGDDRWNLALAGGAR